MRFAAPAVTAALFISCTLQSGATQSGSTPFKLGTFEHEGSTFVGIVLEDSKVIELDRANEAFESRRSSEAKLTMPDEMTGLIARYESELKPRLAAIANEVASAGATTPEYVHALTDVKALPPVSPPLILNAAGNYQEHSQGIAEQRRRSGEAPAPEPTPEASSAPGLWERDPSDTRGNPYLFLKAPTVVTGPYDPIRVPVDRDRIDYECEFAVVVGRSASRVPVERASDHIFGYTIEIDVSDRGGRGDQRMGSDWLVGKSHDTFAPLGPFIVPKEFIENPLDLRQTFTLNDEVMQDSDTSRMTHDIYELLHFASNILTLPPGTVIAGGSPAGTNIERSEPRWMRAGDTAVCTIEGIGTQRHPVVGATPTSDQ